MTCGSPAVFGPVHPGATPHLGVGRRCIRRTANKGVQERSRTGRNGPRKRVRGHLHGFKFHRHRHCQRKHRSPQLGVDRRVQGWLHLAFAKLGRLRSCVGVNQNYAPARYALGAKGVDPFSLGALLITLTAAGGVVTTVIETAWDWLARHATTRRISVTIAGDTIVLERAPRRSERGCADRRLSARFEHRPIRPRRARSPDLAR
jgi:hypothetical protein